MIHQWLVTLTEELVPLVDLLALLLIVAGTLEAFVGIARTALWRSDAPDAGRTVWMRYSRWLVGGLTFQLAADIIETSVTPSWDDIGRIGAIAVIRTFLNYFLERDRIELGEPSAPASSATIPEGKH